jgi:REP element-mobilizing transposase RayT
VHVVVRIRGAWNLRSGQCFQALGRAFAAARERLGMRLCQFSVQSDHIHFLVEAEDARSLGRAMKGLGVRMARALNRVMGKKGAVYAERYHATILRTPSEVASALERVLDHAAPLGLIRRAADPYSSAAVGAAHHFVAAARTWLLATASAARRLTPRRALGPPPKW